LLIDLDNFKAINDSLGHRAGDALICLVAERLAGTVRAGDVLARFGGDEFCVLADGVTGEDEAVRMADRLRESLKRPFVLAGEERYVSASVGVTLAPRTLVDPETLVRDSDTAMYRAKERGKGRSELFDEQLREHVLQRIELENGLRDALAAREL